MTSKIHHDDRDGHITRNIFHCQLLISSVAKVMGLQSCPSVHRNGCVVFHNYFVVRTFFRHKTAFSITAKVILVKSVNFSIIGSNELLVLANKLVLYGVPINYNEIRYGYTI